MSGDLEHMVDMLDGVTASLAESERELAEATQAKDANFCEAESQRAARLEAEAAHEQTRAQGDALKAAGLELVAAHAAEREATDAHMKELQALPSWCADELDKALSSTGTLASAKPGRLMNNTGVRLAAAESALALERRTRDEYAAQRDAAVVAHEQTRDALAASELVRERHRSDLEHTRAELDAMKLTALRATNAQLAAQDDLATAQARVAELEENCREGDSQLERYKAELKAVYAELGRAQEERQKFRGPHRAAESSLASAQSRVAELEEDNNRLDQQLHEAAEAKEAAESALASARKLLERCAEYIADQSTDLGGLEKAVRRWLSSTPAPAPATVPGASPCAECEQLRKRVEELETELRMQGGYPEVVTLRAKLERVKKERDKRLKEARSEPAAVTEARESIRWAVTHIEPSPLRTDLVSWLQRHPEPGPSGGV